MNEKPCKSQSRTQIDCEIRTNDELCSQGLSVEFIKAGTRNEIQNEIDTATARAQQKPEYARKLLQTEFRPKTMMIPHQSFTDQVET